MESLDNFDDEIKEKIDPQKNLEIGRTEGHILAAVLARSAGRLLGMFEALSDRNAVKEVKEVAAEPIAPLSEDEDIPSKQVDSTLPPDNEPANSDDTKASKDADNGVSNGDDQNNPEVKQENATDISDAGETDKRDETIKPRRKAGRKSRSEAVQKREKGLYDGWIQFSESNSGRLKDYAEDNDMTEDEMRLLIDRNRPRTTRNNLEE